MNINFDLILSIIFGIIIGTVLFYLIIGNNSVVYRGPNSKDVKKRMYRDKKNNKCYALEPKVYICPN